MRTAKIVWLIPLAFGVAILAHMGTAFVMGTACIALAAIAAAVANPAAAVAGVVKLAVGAVLGCAVGWTIASALNSKRVGGRPATHAGQS